MEQARTAAFDLVGDEDHASRKRKEMHWDKKKKRFVQGDGIGADNQKLVTTESGAKLPATYRSGRFDEWKAKSRISLPRVGDTENEGGPRRQSGPGGKRFKHNKTQDAKPLDKLSTDYDRKVRQQKKREGAEVAEPRKAGPTRTSGGRYGHKPMGKVKGELKNAEQIRKSRKTLEKRKAKNARPSKKGGKAGKR